MLRTSKPLLAFIGTLVLCAGLGSTAIAQDSGMPDKAAMIKKMQAMAPARGYLDAHKDVQKPKELLGGPIEIHISQDEGGVFAVMPGPRKLDPNVFGTPEYPRAFGGTPGITGLPVPARGVANGEFTQSKMPTPFSDNYIVMPEGKLQIDALDKTATDAAVTEDRVTFMASWKDEAGDTYAVKCCQKLAAHGVEYPTFGGVVTDHILHGFSGVGTALMPTEYSYFAFWGMGAVIKNGEALAKPRLIHGMLTEYVRTSGYKLAFDDEVAPTRWQFHLMVPPMMPDASKTHFEHKPVPTGFTLLNDKELPFWHVMFENLKVSSQRGG